MTSYGETPRLSDLPRPTLEDYRLIELWKEVSIIVHRLRCSDAPAASNGMLEECIRQSPDGPLAPYFRLWIGDNLQYAGRLPEAIAEYRAVADQYPERTFCGQALGAIALEQAASCHERLRQFDEGVRALQESLSRFRAATYPGWTWFRIGQLAEAAGRYEDAITAYSTAADSVDPPNGPTTNYCDVARRNAERLRNGGEWIQPTSEDLIARLTAAVRDGDMDALTRLASRTHFTVGMMWSERCFVNSEQVLTLLARDLKAQRPSLPEGFHPTAGAKIYVPSDGWQGEFLHGSAMFLITSAPGGFEWSGLVLTREPPSGPGWDEWTRMRPKEDPHAPDNLAGDHRQRRNGGPIDSPERPSPPPAMPLTVADLQLKCPWPRGVEFYAGGLIRLGSRLAVFDAPILVSTAAAVPVIGPVLAGLIFGAAAAAAPIIATKMWLDLSSEFPCGVGAGGLYYNQQTTHVGFSAFAIDFATFYKGLLPIGSLSAAVYIANNATLGQPVLAVTDGIVTSVMSGVARGVDPGFANTVSHSIVSSTEEKAAVTAAFFIALFTGSFPTIQTRYSANYLHLDGPALIPVSLGMFVRQGTRLGVMDDTGVSLAQHLHFELVDNTLGATVRPTPMDGQTLEDWDDGRCMHSTNIPLP